MSELNVDPQLLRDAAQGISGIINSLSDLGLAEAGGSGRGFSLIALSGSSAGQGAVQRSLDEFAERWAWGVRTLVKDANAIADELHLAAGWYHDMDGIASTGLKTVAANLAGDPNASSEATAAKPWDEILRGPAAEDPHAGRKASWEQIKKDGEVIRDNASSIAHPK